MKKLVSLLAVGALSIGFAGVKESQCLRDPDEVKENPPKFDLEGFYYKSNFQEVIKAIEGITSLFDRINCDTTHHSEGDLVLTDQSCDQLKGHVAILSENNVDFGYTQVLNDTDNTTYLTHIFEFESFNCKR
ncbi:MAG: hypothetical protein ACON5A_03035 [Candidatus Comchoanobacterales bacterium]